MKRLSILVLVFAFMFTFSLGVLAAHHELWTGNAGTDPLTEEGWLIDAGTLEGWQESNFETLEYQAQGKSEEVGTGITVDGIKVDWKYPGSDNIGKGGDVALNQSIDYTVVAFAEIPCVLKMNVFGNGSWAEAISVGNDSEIVIENTGLYMTDDTEDRELAPGDTSHFMVFDSEYGGVINEAWEFTNIDAVGYDTGQDEDIYINACDLWTAEVWSNVPYGFTVGSAGLNNGEQVLGVEMRYLMSPIPIGDPGNGNVIPLDNNEVINWSTDYVLNAQGVEIGQFSAGQNVNFNMQFRIPVTGASAGRYQGEVIFSSYTI